MLSKNLYRKKSPLADNRKKALLSLALVVALFFIVYGVYTFGKITKTGQKEEIKIETGDRPIKKSVNLFINADKGLSLRKDRDSNAERLTIIPDKTKLEATEELDGWYQVSYNGMTGWIAKEFTTLDSPVADTTSSLGTYQNSYGYGIKYPSGWKLQDYGADASTKTLSKVAFSDHDLPNAISNDYDAPVIVKVKEMPTNDVLKEYNSIGGVSIENITYGPLPAVKYTYTPASTGTEMHSIVVARSDNRVVVLTESGGYLEDLLNMSKNFTI